MTKLFSPKTPAAPAPTPTVATPDVQAAAEAERRRNRTASGKASTMLTGGQGVTTPFTTGTNALLGK
jgi:hypothetical protein